jgi:cobalt-zinc-cadmium efflux system outer membrane protein
MRILVFLLFMQSAEILSDRVLVEQVQHHRADVPAISLAEIEAAAIERNSEIRLMTERVQLAKAGLTPAVAVDDPSFTYRAWSTPLLRPWDLNRTQHMFMFSQTLPASGKRELRYAAANEAVEMAEAELASKKLEIAAAVRAVFYELLRNKEELRLHDEQLAIARQAIAATRIKYTIGRVPQQEVLKAQIAVTKLADHLVMFLQDGEIARARLNTLMGRDPASPLEVAGEYAIPPALPIVADLQRMAVDHRPELKALRAAIRQSEIQVRLAGKNYKPDMTIGAGYMLMPSGSMNRNGYMAELSFNLPWLNRSTHDAAIQESQSRMSVQNAELETRKAIIFQEIQEALIRANSAARLVELYRDMMRPQAHSTLRAASAAYLTDQTDFLNLIDSQNTLIDVEYSYFRYVAEFDSRIADLERAIGTALPKAPPARLEASHEIK